MSHSQFRHIELILRHAWLNLQVKHMLLAGSTRLLTFWVEGPPKRAKVYSEDWAASGGLSMPVLLATSSVARLNAHGVFSPGEGPCRSPKKASYRPDRRCLPFWYCTSTKRISTTTPLPRSPLAQGLTVMGHIVVRRTIGTGLQRLISVFNDFDAFHFGDPDLGFSPEILLFPIYTEKRFWDSDNFGTDP
jgi:hypothetical protein